MKRQAAFIAAVGIVCCFAHAGWSSDLPKPAKALAYLTETSIDVPALLPAPPARGSAEEQAELREILDLQARMTDQDAARVRGEAKFDVFAFAGVVGPTWFDAGHCPRTAALFRGLEADAKHFTEVGKDHWDRPRPPFKGKKFKPGTEDEEAGSYPSSHAARGQLYAEVLAVALPDKADALLSRGQQIGFDRLIAGTHYPSDVAAGRVLGHAIAVKLAADPEYRAALAAVQAELATRGTPAATR